MARSTLDQWSLISLEAAYVLVPVPRMYRKMQVRVSIVYGANPPRNRVPSGRTNAFGPLTSLKACRPRLHENLRTTQQRNTRMCWQDRKGHCVTSPPQLEVRELGKLSDGRSRGINRSRGVCSLEGTLRKFLRSKLKAHNCRFGRAAIILFGFE